MSRPFIGTRRCAVTALALAASSLAAPAIDLVAYDFSLGSATVTRSADNLDATPFRAGPALDTVVVGDGNPGPGWSAQGWSTDSTIDPDTSGSYAFLRLTPRAGQSVTLTSLIFQFRPHGSGPRKGQVEVLVGDLRRPSLPDWFFQHPDQTTPDDPSVYKTWETISLSSPEFRNLTETVEIRFYAYMHSTVTANWRSTTSCSSAMWSPRPSPSPA